MALWGNVDQEADKPSFLNTANKAKTFGVSPSEQAAEAAQGTDPQHAGWVKRNTYTDSQGTVRVKQETLVAMGSMTGDAEDVVMQDITILIGTQPSAVSVTSPADVVLTLATSTVPTGGSVTYQWELSTDTGTTWANATTAASTTTSTLTVVSTDTTDYVTANMFRCVTSIVGGTSVTSEAVAITIA